MRRHTPKVSIADSEENGGSIGVFAGQQLATQTRLRTLTTDCPVPFRSMPVERIVEVKQRDAPLKVTQRSVVSGRIFRTQTSR